MPSLNERIERLLTAPVTEIRLSDIEPVLRDCRAKLERLNTRLCAAQEAWAKVCGYMQGSNWLDKWWDQLTAALSADQPPKQEDMRP